MTIAEKLLRQKTDFDEVYSAGYEKGKSEGGTNNNLLDGLINRSITSIENTTVTSIGSAAFQYCRSLTFAKFTEVLSVSSNAFTNCTALIEVDFATSPTFNAASFNACELLDKFIIRGQSVAKLSNTNAFTNTPIAKGTGIIYVTDEFVESYKSATNWSTFADKIKGISELEVSE